MIDVQELRDDCLAAFLELPKDKRAIVSALSVWICNGLINLSCERQHPLGRVQVSRMVDPNVYEWMKYATPKEDIRRGWVGMIDEIAAFDPNVKKENDGTLTFRR